MFAGDRVMKYEMVKMRDIPRPPTEKAVAAEYAASQAEECHRHIAEARSGVFPCFCRFSVSWGTASCRKCRNMT